jgi:ankyrin repeat protein
VKTILALLILLSCSATALAQDANGSSGSPYGWTTMGGIKRLPHDGRPDAKVEFPQIQDWKSLKISLQRTPCFGSCPAYRVDIYGDGTVTYDGQMFVAISGAHKAKLSDDALRTLFTAFQKADFFWLLDRYAAPITDNPTQVISISFDEHNKTVEDYIGRAVGMPSDVTDLENLIDTVADTKKWVTGNDETIAALETEGWSFKAPDEKNTQLLAAAAEARNTELVEQFLKAGMPATNKFGCHALSDAAENRDIEMAHALFAAGAPLFNKPRGRWIDDPKTDAEQKADFEYAEDACDVLLSAAIGGSPEILSLALSRKPDVNKTIFNGTQTPLMALSGHSDNDYAAKHGADFGRSAQLLIAAGADVNIADDRGRTALMGAEKLEVVRAILAAGVKDINARDNSGQTALMQTYHANVTEVLLEAGASPYLKDRNGRTALDHAGNFSDPILRETLEHWMQAHPEQAYLKNP